MDDSSLREMSYKFVIYLEDTTRQISDTSEIVNKIKG